MRTTPTQTLSSLLGTISNRMDDLTISLETISKLLQKEYPFEAAVIKNAVDRLSTKSDWMVSAKYALDSEVNRKVLDEKSEKIVNDFLNRHKPKTNRSGDDRRTSDRRIKAKNSKFTAQH